MTQYNLAAFQQFAGQLGKAAKIGDVFLLHGDLGAGKTTFAQAFIKSRYPDVMVTSPTFSICQEYDDIVHYDLYRVNDSEELLNLDILEHLHTKICLIEWPQNLGSLAPKSAQSIYIEMTDNPSLRTIRRPQFPLQSHNMGGF